MRLTGEAQILFQSKPDLDHAGLGLTDREITDRDARRQSMLARYAHVRGHTDVICQPLSAEDYVIQSMPDASPLRWHLAHTTWFFETFVLKRLAHYRPVCEQFEYLFNSYYNTVGAPYPRDRRGLLSRPTVVEVQSYRASVDDRLRRMLADPDLATPEVLDVVELGLQHEQQHQELMWTDLKHMLSCNPLWPAYRQGDLHAGAAKRCSRGWIDFAAAVHSIGHAGDGFAFDNESPRHRVFAEPYALATDLVTNGDYLEFIDDGGYRRPELWLSMGWTHVNQHTWTAPLYWTLHEDRYHEFTLAGLKPLDSDLPVTHVSYFEADAYARWAGLRDSGDRSPGPRLPTEAEWEIAAASQTHGSQTPADPLVAQAIGRGPASDTLAPVHPFVMDSPGDWRGLFGTVWQWTCSAYSAYPGYRAATGALGEYNGKFMCNQYVLRGSSCATSDGHTRRTYRNFFPPEARWQFTGIRLAK